MPTMNDIDRATRAYAEARELLTQRTAALRDGMEALKRNELPGIKRALEKATARQAELQALLESAPDLFVKPRTVVLHGVKVGFEKGKGKIEFDDAVRVCKLIKSKLPEKADVLIDTVEKPVKKALAQLTVAELKSLGCTVQADGDVVVIRPIDSELDKLVQALMRGALDDTVQAQQAEATE